MLSGDKLLSQIMLSEFRDALLTHARASKSKSLSYQDVALLVGRLTLAVATSWWMLGSGAPKVHAWWWRTLVPHQMLIVVLGLLVALVLAAAESFRWSVACPEGLRDPLGKPAELIGDLFHAARLLLGIATISLVAEVPGA